MKNQEFENRIKLFQVSNQLLENDLDAIERKFAVDLGRGHVSLVQSDGSYYPQIDQRIRQEAAQMASSYEVFYSLEKTIRAFIADSFYAAGVVRWWDSQYIPSDLKARVEERIQKEIDTGVTPRSDDPIDYTTFGELGEIIKANWDVFSGSLKSEKAALSVLARLNTLRAPIAHCSMLAEDEVLRLQLSVRDWFRLMD